METNRQIPYGELAVLVGLLCVINLPLLQDRIPVLWLFVPNSLVAGDWWRWWFHPFAHLSRYHLFLDASAFLWLYTEIPGPCRRRVCLLLCCGAGALAGAVFLSPSAILLGYGGLSGPAHGLMAVFALGLAREARTRQAGRIALAVLALKCFVELVAPTGWTTLFHVGSVGIPVTGAHTGGALAGLLWAWCDYGFRTCARNAFGGTGTDGKEPQRHGSTLAGKERADLKFRGWTGCYATHLSPGRVSDGSLTVRRDSGVEQTMSTTRIGGSRDEDSAVHVGCCPCVCGGKLRFHEERTPHHDHGHGAVARSHADRG